MRKYYFLIMAGLLAVAAHASDPDYSVLSLPKALLKNADVVKRNEEIRFEVMNNGETVLYKKYALTILNESGDEYAGFYEWYDKLHQIRSVEGNLYDMAGRQIKKVKGKDIQDVSGTDGSSLADDNRVKMHNFYYKGYPYTVEYEVEIKFSHTFYFPGWTPQEHQYLSVEKSSFTFVAPADYTVRYKNINYKGEPVITTDKNKKIMTWQVNALPAISKQFAAPVWDELTTSVMLGPTDFSVEDYKGNMSSWKEFGKFVYALKKDREQLPADVIQKVQQLTAGSKDEKEKIKILYDFLQKTTRYVSIQLGIGGWQPFDAAFVAQKGYGDCKALSNYMVSLLKAAGIKSYYTLVDAGREMKNHQMVVDFPSSNQFNHIIVCVPVKNDTVWLECTSQSTPAGYMGRFTGNRKVLLVDENGGVVVNTPEYGSKENLQIRSVAGKADPEGSMSVKVRTVYTGIQQDNLQGMINNLSKDKVKKELNEMLALSTYDINDFKYEEKKNTLPEIDEHLDLFISRYATISGKRLFIVPNLLNQSSIRLTDTAARTYDYQFDIGYRDVDSVEIELPAGYAPESLPADVNLKTKFGTYSSRVKLENNKLYYVRTCEQNAGRFPAKDKDELTAYFEAVYKADRARVVLVKTNP